MSLCPSALTVRPSPFLSFFPTVPPSLTSVSTFVSDGDGEQIAPEAGLAGDAPPAARLQGDAQAGGDGGGGGVQEEGNNMSTALVRPSHLCALSQSTYECCSKLVIQIELVLSRLTCGSALV